MEYRGMSEQEAYHKGYFDGQAAMGDLLKSAPIKGPTYKLSESNSIDVLTQINKSQAKEIEGLRGKVKLYEQFIKNGVETNNIRIPDLIDPARKTIDELLDTTLLGTTQPDTKQKD